jgi:hypothetical protein
MSQRCHSVIEFQNQFYSVIVIFFAFFCIFELLGAIVHRLQKKGGLDTEFPIFLTTAYFGPVYYNDCSALPRYIN